MRKMATTKEERREMYLFCYNVFMFAGWLRIAYVLISGCLFCEAFNADLQAKLVRNTADGVLLLQLISTLEILHSIFKMVKGSTLAVIGQTIGRDVVLFFFINKFNIIQHHWSAILTFLAWSLAEIIRYPYYASLIVDVCPQLLKWLRYSAFIVLYPLGFFAEFMTIYVGYKIFQEEGCYSCSSLLAAKTSVVAEQTKLPIFFTIGLGIYTFLAYAVCGPFIYYYMLKQRKRHIKHDETSSKKSKKQD
mmetsp:Transcript_13390/g.17660  ORF Transcript_13390/g.17660 Transcript_13390/m.17660 type:complete len:248 (-) Transcript_13390:416-1159(-)